MNIKLPISLKGFGKRTTTIALLSVLLGGGATAAVFAAIPNSNNGLISACRNKLLGTVRVIDAQSGAQCSNTFETGLSWMSSDGTTSQNQTAVLWLDRSPTDSLQLAVDSAKSHNIVSSKIVTDPNSTSDPQQQYFCVDVAFDPTFAVNANLVPELQAGVGGFNGLATQVNGIQLSTGQLPGAPNPIQTECGAGYNVMFNYTTAIGTTAVNSAAFMLFK